MQYFELASIMQRKSIDKFSIKYMPKLQTIDFELQ